MKLYFQKSGTGPALFILHGLLGSSDNWLSHARKLHDRYTVYLIDQRNHGRSPHSEVMNFEAMAGDLEELLRHDELEQVYMLGHSMGAKTAMCFDQLYPGQVRKLILADMGVKAYEPHHKLIFRGLQAVEVPHCPSRSEAERRMSEFIPDVSTRQFLLKSLYWNEQGVLAWRFNLQVLMEQNAQLLRAMDNKVSHTPALFIRGEKSNYVTDEDMEHIREVYPQAQFHTLAGAGHWLHVDAPGPFLQAVEHFLQ